MANPRLAGARVRGRVLGHCLGEWFGKKHGSLFFHSTQLISKQLMAALMNFYSGLARRLISSVLIAGWQLQRAPLLNFTFSGTGPPGVSLWKISTS